MAVSNTLATNRVPAALPANAGQRGGILPLLPLTMLFYSTLLPVEIRIDLAGQVIFAYRAATFLILPWALTRLFTQQFTLRLADLLILIGGLWMLVSFIAFYGFGDGLVRGGALVMDVLPPYFIARISIRDTDDIRRLLILFAPGLFLAGMSVVAESLTHQTFVRPLAASIFGEVPIYIGGEVVGANKYEGEIRLGLMRASGPFSHSILAGAFLASFIPVYLLAGMRGWPTPLGVLAGAAAIFSLSSGAILSLAMVLFLLSFDWLNRHFSFTNWRLFLLAMTILMFILEFATQNGLINVLIRFTLNPETGYFRLLIWEYGTRSVMNFPWFGIGFSEYERLPWMVASVDNYWLLLAMRHGLITSVFLFLGSITMIYQLSDSSRFQYEIDRRLLVGLAITLFSMMVVGFTVSFFGSIQILLYLLLGISGSAIGTPIRKSALPD